MPPPRQPLQWFSLRGRRGPGFLAYVAMRLSGIGLVLYLYLHLAVLRQLAGGPDEWDRFVVLARSPLFLALDVLLIAGLLVHGLNGLRVVLLGFGFALARQRLLLLLAGALAVVLTVLSAVAIFSEAG